jgi:hypothetical protein
MRIAGFEPVPPQPAADSGTPDTVRILVVSDIHYAGDTEKRRGNYELNVAEGWFGRQLLKSYRRYIWLKDPFAHNHLLDRAMDQAGAVDYAVANGDYSCDSRFVGVSDDGSFESAALCLQKLRLRFGSRLKLTIGDHELGKFSIAGRRGGLRLASWERTVGALGIEPFWTVALGNYLVVGVTSSLISLPGLAPEMLDEERQAWSEIRIRHMDQIRAAFAATKPSQRLILFCHDPTALPFLAREEAVRTRLSQIEQTIIGHLHTPLVFWSSRILAGFPEVHRLGNSIRKMSSALRDARLWKHFHVTLCPSLAGCELLRDGGYLLMELSPEGSRRSSIQYCRLAR